MFGIGLGELILILIVLVIVIKPEEIPSLLRKTAKIVEQLKQINLQASKEIKKIKKDIEEE